MTRRSLQTLLAPLAGDSPCGADLSFSPEFDQLQELRRADDPALSQGEWVTPLKTAEWAAAASLCERLLAERTKDLRVAGWLMQAWSHLHGIEGLADGIALVQGLCEQHWADVHPPIEDGHDAELRNGTLAWLLTQLAMLSAQVPVLQEGGAALTLRDMTSARRLQAAPRTAADGSPADGPDKVTLDQVMKAQRATPSALLVARLADTRRAQAALQALEQQVDAQLGTEGPAFGPAREALDDLAHTLERLVRDAAAGNGSRSVPMPALAGTVSAPVSAESPAALHGAPATRAQALAQLISVAEFFRRTEPHSPVAYLAERAARWGEMPLHAWLRTVLKDGGTLAQLEELLGVEAPPASGDAPSP